MGWFSARNLLALAAAPFTAGLSTLAMENGDGDSIIGDLTGENSAKKANKKNIALQKATNEQSIALANSAHQREVADLKAAGLNPVLSAGGSGSATPTLGTAQVQNTLPGGYLAQAQSAGQVASLFSSAKQMNAQAKLSNEQAGAVDSQIRLNKAQAQIAEDQDEFYQDTGYFPGATEGTSTGVNAGWGAYGQNRSQNTTIRNTNKGNSARSGYQNDKAFKNMSKEKWQKLSKAQKAMFPAELRERYNNVYGD